MKEVADELNSCCKVDAVSVEDVVDRADEIRVRQELSDQEIIELVTKEEESEDKIKLVEPVLPPPTLAQLANAVGIVQRTLKHKNIAVESRICQDLTWKRCSERFARLSSIRRARSNLGSILSSKRGIEICSQACR